MAWPVLRNRWAVLVLTFALRLAMAVQFQAIAAVGPLLVRELGLGYAAVGWLLGVYMLPGAVLALPGGLLGARFGDRALLLGSLALMVVGGVALPAVPALGMSEEALVALMLGARVVAGVGAVVLNMQLTKITADWFAGREAATAMAVSAAAFGLGVGVATGLLGLLADVVGWAGAVGATALPPLVGLAVVAAAYRDPAGTVRHTGGLRGLWTLTARDLAMSALAGTAQVGFVTGYVVFMSFAPALLVARGVPLGEAGALVGVVALVSLVSVPLGGVLSDRTGRPDVFILGGAMGTAAAAFLLPVGGPALLWLLLFGLLRGGCSGGVMALPGQVLPPEKRHVGFGVYYTVHFLGMALLPPAAGALRDATDNAALPVVMDGGIWLLIVLAVPTFRLLQRRWYPQTLAPPAAREDA